MSVCSVSAPPSTRLSSPYCVALLESRHKAKASRRPYNLSCRRLLRALCWFLPRRVGRRWPEATSFVRPHASYSQRDPSIATASYQPATANHHLIHFQSTYPIPSPLSACDNLGADLPPHHPTSARARATYLGKGFEVCNTPHQPPTTTTTYRKHDTTLAKASLADAAL